MTTDTYHVIKTDFEPDDAVGSHIGHPHYQIRSERKLTDGKGGVVVSFVFSGDPSMTINYKSQKDEVKELTIVWGDNDPLELRVPGTIIYAHIDDELNELLVISGRDFPY